MGEFPYMEFLARLYLKKAEHDRCWATYLKAHGLANYCVTSDVTEERIRLVYDIEDSWYHGKHPLTYNEHQQLTNQHRKLLQDYRMESEFDLECLESEEKQLDIENIFSRDNMNHAMAFARNIFSMSKRCSDNFIKISRSILCSSIAVLSDAKLAAPCHFAVIGLGSVAKGEATPYSDLEYAFIVQSEADDDYFVALAMDSYFRIGNLGETPLKCFDIAELQQKVVPSQTIGYRIDGISMNAGNIPTGSPGGQTLILTIDDFMKLYKKSAIEQFRGIAGDKSDMLSSSVLIYSTEREDNSNLYQRCIELVREYEISEGQHNIFICRKRLQSFALDVKRYSFLPEFEMFQPPSNLNIKVKADIFRYPTLLANNFRVCMSLESCHPWEVFTDLDRQKMLSENSFQYLMILLALSIYIRTKSYIIQGHVSEQISLYTPNTEASKNLFYVPRNLFVTLGCLLAPIKRSIRASVQRCCNELMTNHNIHVSQLVNLVAKDIQVDETNFLVKAEVAYFAGDYSMALDFLNKGIGKKIQSDVSGEQFVEIVRKKCGTFKQDWAEMRYLGLCCYLLDFNTYYRVAIEYASWLLLYKISPSVVNWKCFIAGCSIQLHKYKAAQTQLCQALEMVKQMVGCETQNSLSEFILYRLQKNDAFSEELLERYKCAAYIFYLHGVVNTKHKKPDDAIIWLKHSYAISQKLLARSQCEIRTIANTQQALGLAHQMHNKLTDALKWHFKALDSNKLVYGTGTNHEDIAKSYSYIGNVYCTMGEYSKSLENHSKSLAMMKAVYGSEANHPDLVESCNNLAMLYERLGNARLALRYYMIALDMMKAIYGASAHHSGLATIYHNIGIAYQNCGDFTNALKYLKESLAMEKVMHGCHTKHHDIATMYNNIAAVYDDMGDYKSSMKYYNEALSMFKEIHGMQSDHASIAGCYQDLGNVYSNMSMFGQSVNYFSKALLMSKKLYGADTKNIGIASIHQNLGRQYWGMGNYSLSLEHYKKCVEMREAVYGLDSNHQDITLVYSFIGDTYRKDKQLQEALRYQKLALELAQHPNSNNHLGTVVYFLSLVYFDFDDYRESLRLLQSAVSVVAGRQLKANMYLLMSRCNSALHNWRQSWCDLHSALGCYETLPNCRVKLFHVAKVHCSIATLLFRLCHVPQSLEQAQLAMNLINHLLSDKDNLTFQYFRLHSKINSIVNSLHLIKICNHQFPQH